MSLSVQIQILTLSICQKMPPALQYYHSVGLFSILVYFCLRLVMYGELTGMIT